MTPLTSRLREIIERRAGLTEARVNQYFGILQHAGYDLTGFDPAAYRSAMNFTGAVVPCGPCRDKQKPCGGCKNKPVGPVHSTVKHALARVVTKWAVGITTAPRKTPTLARCVASVIRAGFTPTVFAEPGSASVPGIPTFIRRERLGCWRNYVQTLRDLLSLHPEAEAIAVFQDDVVACLDLREFLEHDLWPSQQTGVVSLYSPEEYESGSDVGIDRRKKMILGLQAAAYPRAIAQRMVDQYGNEWRGCHSPKKTIEQTNDDGTKTKIVVPNYIDEPHLKKAADTWVAESISKMGKAVFHYRPSLTQHLDAQSAIGHGGVNQIREGTGKHYRKSTGFIGEDTSALDAWADDMPWCRWSAKGIQRYRQHDGPLPSRPVTVVIPGYGCPDLTRECLTHLERSTVRPSVVYVDDGSTDAEWAEVLAIPSTLDIRHIRHDGNKGFTAACNSGIAAADPSSHVLLLNNDTRIGTTCIERLRWHAETHANVGAVGPVTGDDGAQSLKHSRHATDAKFKGNFAADRYAVETEQKLTRGFVIEWPVLSGYCMFINRDALDRIGPLSDAAHLRSGLVADDEWCKRATAAGMRNFLVYNAWCAHLHKTTFRRQGIDRAALHRAALQGTRRGN